MSQAVWSEIIASSTSGNQLAVLLNSFKDAIMSGLKGPSRPTQITAGGMWVDDSDEGNNIWTIKIFNGTTDISVFSINIATGVASVMSSDSQFTISKTSADVLPGILRHEKSRIANNGQVLDGDSIGVTRFFAKDDSGAFRQVAEMRIEVSDNVTSAAHGSYFVWETTPDNTNAMAEVMRLVEGNLGVGVVVPLERIHADGNIRFQNNTDTSNASELIGFKRRIAGTGAVQNADGILNVKATARDSAGTEYVASTIETVATENATATNRGNEIQISTIDNGESAATKKLTIGETLVSEVDAEAPNVSVDTAFYIGAENVDGSWRFIKNGADLEIQVRLAGVWTMKDSIGA
jgi:hypothetical protein